MGFPAAYVGATHFCPALTVLVPHVGGPIIGPGCPTVMHANMPASVQGDNCTCVGPPATVTKGSSTVKICNKPAARLLDTTAHGGMINLGSPTIFIGG